MSTMLIIINVFEQVRLFHFELELGTGGKPLPEPIINKVSGAFLHHRATIILKHVFVTGPSSRYIYFSNKIFMDKVKVRERQAQLNFHWELFWIILRMDDTTENMESEPQAWPLSTTLILVQECYDIIRFHLAARIFARLSVSWNWTKFINIWMQCYVSQIIETLDNVMACCPTAPIHYVNQCCQQNCNSLQSLYALSW